MARIPMLALVPPAIFLGLAVLFYAGMQREDPDALPSTLIGRQVPPLDVGPLGAAPLTDAAALEADGVKLVNFWASWCGPCRVEHPSLMALADETDVAVHGINYRDRPEAAAAFLAELGDPYDTIGVDRAGRTGRDWGVYGVPETFVIDGDGTVILRFAGPITERVLAETIRPAIAAARDGS